MTLTYSFLARLINYYTNFNRKSEAENVIWEEFAKKKKKIHSDKHKKFHFIFGVVESNTIVKLGKVNAALWLQRISQSNFNCFSDVQHIMK